MRVLDNNEITAVSGGGDAAACGNAVIGAGGVGAVAGALIGGAIGSVIPVVGTAVGAAIGSGIGTLVAGGYVAENGEACQN